MILALVLALIGGAVLTPLVRLVARRAGMVTKPAADRWARQPTALLGGIAIFLAAVAGVALTAVLQPGSFAVTRPVVGIIVCGFVAFAVGLLDDVLTLKPNRKFVFQLLAGILLVSFDAIIGLTGQFWIDVLFTVFWVVAVTNALNLLDNMDGVAAGVAAIAAFCLGLASLRAGDWTVTIIAWSMAGAAAGFLIYNFQPASIFMGDAGSLFLGAMLAALAAASPSRSSGSVISALFVPLVIIAVPVLDTALVTITRAIAGRAFYQGGRDHTAHRLVALGLSERRVALLLYAFAAAGGAIGLWLSRLNLLQAMALGLAFLSALSLFAAWLGHLHVEYANEPQGSKRVTVLVTQLLYKRRLGKLVLDATLLAVGWVIAFELRFDGSVPAPQARAMESLLPTAVGVQLLAFLAAGVFKGAWRYIGVTDMYRIAAALVASGFALLAYAEWRVPALAATSSVIYINAMCSGLLVLGARLAWRSLQLARRRLQLDGAPVIVYGAGDGADLALREMANNRDLGLLPVCLLDDDARTHGSRMHGVRVLGGIESAALAIERFNARRLVITTNRLRPEIRSALEALAERTGIDLAVFDLRLKAFDRSSVSNAQPPLAQAR